MAKIYYTQILRGKKEYGDVPQRWAAQVEVLFHAAVVEGTLTKDEYKQYIGVDYPYTDVADAE